MTDGAAALASFIAAETALPVHPAVMAVAEEIRRRRGAAVAAVLFYGSCLRQNMDPLAGDVGVLDFYVLVDRYRDTYGRRLSAWANALLPPNVFYVETPWQGRTMRAKYAVVSLGQFRRGTSRRSFHSSLWARFAQPSRLLYARDGAARRTVVDALGDAVATMVGRALPLVGDSFTAEALWTRGFIETYRAELRAEGPDRAHLIYEADRGRYERFTGWALAANGIAWTESADGSAFRLAEGLSAGRRRLARLLWFKRRAFGKLLTVLRLVKGIFTFAGAMDYVLWKIERHSGVRAVATPWQRRHPLLASPVLAWRLYRQGAFR